VCRAQADHVLGGIAAHHRATPQEVVLSRLADLASAILPIPGATRVETARSTGRAATLRLTDSDRALLDARFATSAALRDSSAKAAPVMAASPPRGEVVMIMGLLLAAGKSTLAQTLVERGYEGLNRDRSGESLRDRTARCPDGIRRR
jgi:hypothetical protein